MERTDKELLGCFLTHRDETAFEALLQRHGPMVLRVCQRTLLDDHEAQDAFQATFLILARKASAIQKAESVGSWLYGVALRTATRRRAQIATRSIREKEAGTMISSNPTPSENVWPAIDEELKKLPEKYREPLISCYLEGRTYQEVARELGCGYDEIRGVLHRARDLLRTRLIRRGVTLSAATLSSLFSDHASAITISPELLAATSKAAFAVATRGGSAMGGGAVSQQVITLTQGTMKTMLIEKLSTSLVTLLVFAGVVAGTGIMTYHFLAGRQRSPGATMASAPLRSSSSFASTTPGATRPHSAGNARGKSGLLKTSGPKKGPSEPHAVITSSPSDRVDVKQILTKLDDEKDELLHQNDLFEKSHRILNEARQLDAAKDQYALENNKGGNMTPAWEDLTPYLKAGTRLATGGGTDIYGNPFIIGGLQDRLTVNPKTKEALSEATSGDVFWGPYS